MIFGHFGDRSRPFLPSLLLSSLRFHAGWLLPRARHAGSEVQANLDIWKLKSRTFLFVGESIDYLFASAITLLSH